LNAIFQRATRQIFHHAEKYLLAGEFAQIQDANNIGMVETRGSLCAQLKAPHHRLIAGILRQQHLDCHINIQQVVTRAEDLAEAALTQAFLQFVVLQRIA
jgi:hypothetical protein